MRVIRQASPSALSTSPEYIAATTRLLQREAKRASVEGYSPLSVTTYVPRAALDSIKERGLLSGDLLADPENRELLELARPGDKAAEWLALREQIKKEQPWTTTYDGPSILFGDIDAESITDEHPSRDLDTVPVRIDLAKILAEVPDSKVHGVELVPDTADAEWEALSEEEKDNFVDARHHDLTAEELQELVGAAANPKEFWKHYNDPTYYAANVPHGQLILPDGRVPTDYLEFPEEAPLEKAASVTQVTKRLTNKQPIQTQTAEPMFEGRQASPSALSTSPEYIAATTRLLQREAKRASVEGYYIPTEEDYVGLSHAETGGEEDPYIRTKVRTVDGGSTASGPVQLTATTMRSLLKSSPELFNEHLPWVEKFLQQGKQFAHHGNMKGKLEEFDPSFDYGGKGYYEDEGFRSSYKDVASQVMIAKAREQKAKTREDFITAWRGHVPEVEYMERFNKGVAGYKPEPPKTSPVQVTKRLTNKQPIQTQTAEPMFEERHHIPIPVINLGEPSEPQIPIKRIQM